MNAQSFGNVYQDNFESQMFVSPKHSWFPNICKSRTFVNHKRSNVLEFYSSITETEFEMRRCFERLNGRIRGLQMQEWGACKCMPEGCANADMRMESEQMHILMSERTNSNNLKTEWVSNCEHKLVCKCRHERACKCTILAERNATVA